MFEIRAKQHKYLEHEIAEYAHSQALKKEIQEGGVFKNERWKKVLDYLFQRMKMIGNLQLLRLTLCF